MRKAARSAYPLLLLLCIGFAGSSGPLLAQEDETAAQLSPPPSAVKAGAEPSGGSADRAGAGSVFDPVGATEAYLAKVPADKRAKSDAYFEGGYWLQLWDFLYGLGVAAFLLAGRVSFRIRNLAERITRRRPLQTVLYWVPYLVLATLLVFPMTVYESFFREHQYGLATQTFGPWLWDQLKGLAVSLVLGALLVTLLYGIVRRTPRTWWIWGSTVTVAFQMFVAMIVPVYIAPLFNTYTKLADASVSDPILSMARASGIATSDVFEMDASRQTTRVSANVSGFLGTERITLNDNLLKRCALPEIQAVMGHEMGHYVLNHVYEGVLEFGVIIVLGFVFLRWGFDWVLLRWGGSWGITGIGDLAGLPLAVAVFSVFMFLMTPVVNTVIRANEAEADIFGLNASGQPDGMAEVALKLGEYRKLAPGPVEEFVFFDHPSGRNRILMAMKWKAEHR